MSATLGDVSFHALRWVASNLHRFEPRNDNHAQAMRAVKALAELLLIADLASTEYPGYSVIEKVIRAATNIWDDPLYRARALRNPRMFRLYLAPLATLNRCGRALSQHDREIVKQVLATGYAQQVAEVPFREMDVDWTLIRLEYPLPQSPSSNMSQLIARSLIGRRIPALEF